MAALSNPVNNVNLISRFDDYVKATASAGIVWGTNSLPVYAPGTPYATTVIPATAMGGTTAGRNTAQSIDAGQIIANTIFTQLNAYTFNYCYIRSVRALLTVTGQGGNIGTKPNAGEVFDLTRVTYLNTNAKGPAPAVYAAPVQGVVAANQVISATEVENFLARCRAAYNNYARNQSYLYSVSVCHASCHSACHGSRGRR